MNRKLAHGIREEAAEATGSRRRRWSRRRRLTSGLDLPPFHRRRHSFVDELKSKLPLLSFLFKMKKQWIQSNPTRRGEARE
jgi:hypothetical protein